jgi:hypothetical protein
MRPLSFRVLDDLLNRAPDWLSGTLFGNAMNSCSRQSLEFVVAKAGIPLARDFARCAREIVVAKAGIEPATHGFSVRCSTN